MQGPGPFYGGPTSYQAAYSRHELAPLWRHKREKYRASEAPMNTVPLYRASYVDHRAPPARSCRPPPVPPVNVPLSESTEHRDNFAGEARHVCPAVPLLQRVPGCVLPDDPPHVAGRFRYRERDEAGHEWYTYEDRPHNPRPHEIEYDADRYVRSEKAAQAKAAADRALNWTPPRLSTQTAIV